MDHKKRKGHGEPPPWRLPRSVWLDTEAAMLVLIENDNFVSDTRERFASRMGWFRPHGCIDLPDVDRVKAVCAHSKDQAESDIHGGMVITYAPNSGGMVLIDPDSEIPDAHAIHMLVGDLQAQVRQRTINRRRRADWKQVGQAFANSNDLDLARLCWQAEDEIAQTGWVAGSTMEAILKALAGRGFLE